MKIWSISFNERDLENFPQIIYKNRPITIEEETYLTNKIFEIFLLTHRDAKQTIMEIKNIHSFPYKKLHNLVFPDPNYEFATEYFIDILNLFSIEI